MKGENFEMYGPHDVQVKISFNSMKTKSDRQFNICFPKLNTKYIMSWPMFKLDGTIFGQRILNFDNLVTFYNEKTH